MDKLEYIPGDLVSVYVGIKKFIVEVIGVENENEVLSYQIKFPNGEIQYADKDNIVPIPLTPEILEKNGWTCYRSEGECFGHRWYKHQEYPFTLRYNNFLGIIGVSFNDGKDDTVMIKCVDELQHILFDLQLDSNLKI